MNDKRPADVDPLEDAWRPMRVAEPPDSLNQEVQRRIREAPLKPPQSSFGWALPAATAVLGVLAIAALATRWSDNLAGPGALPPTSTASAPASPTAPAASASSPSASAASTPTLTAAPSPGGSLPPPVTGKAWTKDGQLVPWSVLSLDTGPQHCGWENILFLRMSSRLGEPTSSNDNLMEYVRDPSNTWATASPNPEEHRTLGRFERSSPSSWCNSGSSASPRRHVISPR